MLKKVTRFFTVRFLAVFALTFFLGFGINSLSGNYWFYLIVTETFTNAEAEAKLNKQIAAKCLGDSKPARGTVVSIHQTHFGGQILIGIEWDEPLLGKYEQSFVG